MGTGCANCRDRQRVKAVAKELAADTLEKVETSRTSMIRKSLATRCRVDARSCTRRRAAREKIAGWLGPAEPSPARVNHFGSDVAVAGYEWPTTCLSPY